MNSETCCSFAVVLETYYSVLNCEQWNVEQEGGGRAFSRHDH